jgi:hypothetical protein
MNPFLSIRERGFRDAIVLVTSTLENPELTLIEREQWEAAASLLKKDLESVQKELDEEQRVAARNLQGSAIEIELISPV